MNTAKCYRVSCPYMKDNKCGHPNGSCGGNRWTSKPKQKNEIVEEEIETKKEKKNNK